MLVENGRLTALPEIATQFHALRNAQEGAADAEIVSAFEMTPAQVVEALAAYRDAGAEAAYLQLLDIDDLDHVRLLAAEVMAHL